MKTLPTGRHGGKTAQHWEMIVRVAERGSPVARSLAAQYRKAGHPATLNAIADNVILPADFGVVRAYHAK